MPALEAIRQDIRRETGHGSEGQRLVDQLIHLRDRKLSGRLTHGETMRVHGDMAQRSHELRAWLRDRGLDDLARYVARAVNAHTASMDDVPASRDPEFDIGGGR